MRYALLVILTLTLLPQLFGQRHRLGIIVPAGVRLCGNAQVTAEKMSRFAYDMRAEGCDDIRFLYIAENDLYLGWGVKILRGE